MPIETINRGAETEFQSELPILNYRPSLSNYWKNNAKENIK